jgi:hypothetical protein
MHDARCPRDLVSRRIARCVRADRGRPFKMLVASQTERN